MKYRGTLGTAVLNFFYICYQFPSYYLYQKIEITRPKRPISSPHGKSFLGVTSCDGFSLGADAPANRKSRSVDYPMIACFAALPA
jgi:hypothetical protein